MAQRRTSARRRRQIVSAKNKQKKRKIYTRNGRGIHFSPFGCIVRLLIVAVVVVAIYLFLQSSLFSLTTIEVRGVENLSESEVINLSGLQNGENIFKADRKEAEKQISLHAAVATVDVRVRPPHKILINVQERQGVAVVYYENVYYIVDEEGYLITRTDAAYEPALSLITGLDIPGSLNVGTQLTSARSASALTLAAAFHDRYPESQKEISAETTSNLRATFNGKEVRFGDTGNLNRKLKALDEALANLPAGGWDQLVYVDVSNPRDVYVEMAPGASSSVTENGANGEAGVE